MTEINAAIGLCCLDNIDFILQRRAEIAKSYENHLSGIDGIKIHRPKIEGFVTNNLYFPVLFEDEEILVRVEDSLKTQDVYPRRYFYPSLNGVGIFDKNAFPISEDYATRVLCLPIHTEMSVKDSEKVAGIIAKAI